ncbi:MAG: PilZ domain-containing protein [Pyrinomonadaceae bacterium]|nr:PilZ domain-containing protein [Pyrinomonadaceae bacterium]
MIRKLAAKITGLMAERSHSARKRFNAPIKIVIEPYGKGIHTTSSDTLFIAGETCDLSRSGIGFIVPSIRIKEFYLVGQERTLLAEIDLPGGKMRMKVVGRRYERVGLHDSVERYLIGAEIVEMTKEEREVYEHFLRYGTRKRKATAPGFELGGS